MRITWFGALGAIAATACMLTSAPSARAENVLAQISVRNTHLPGRYYGRMFVFPEGTRDYSPRSFFGYSFRQELPEGAVRYVEVGRVRTRGPYLLLTDLFANGRLSTMSHTVVMMFPRVVPGAELFALEEDLAGDLHLVAPDGSHLWVDGQTERLKTTADFAVDPPGAVGTPPRFRHRGLHLAIRAVGRSPFLRGTPVEVRDRSGGSCVLTTDDIFLYRGPESDVFRFDGDEAFFGLLAERCPNLALPRPPTQPAVRPAVAMAVANPRSEAPLLAPSAGVVRASSREAVGEWSGRTGVLPLLSRLLSN